MSKLFTKIPLENIAVTQPQGDLGTYNRSTNSIDIDEMERFQYYVNVKERYEDIQVYRPYIGDTFPLANNVNTNTSVIEDLEIKSLEAYKISLELFMYNVSMLSSEDITISIYYGATLIKEETYEIDRVNLSLSEITPKYINPSITVNYTPTTLDSFSVKYSTNAFIYVSKANFSITAVETVELPVRSYARLIDKILRHQPYTLNAYSRNKLDLTAPEDKYENYTIYDALNKIGAQNGAILRFYDLILERYWQSTATTGTYIEATSVYDESPYEHDLGTVIKIGDSYYKNVEGTDYVREIGYDFFDDHSTIDMPYNSYDEVAELEDYVAGIQSSAKNVLKPLRYSPFKNGFKGVRSSDIGKQTTSNIHYECEDMVERPIKVLVKGRAGANADESIVYTEDDETDITSNVVNYLYYQTLTNEKDISFSGKQTLRKHNSIYYTQGLRELLGFSYLGEELDLVIGDNYYKRAIYECIDAVRSIESGELIIGAGQGSGSSDSYEDEGLDGDIKLRLQVTYQNITETSARVFKDDLSGFEHETIKYINESANINESKALGDNLQLVVNRLGGTKTIISGVVDSEDELPQLGDIDSNGKVYTVIKTTHGDRIKYEMTLVQDYNVISSYIGIKSRLRFEEVSSSDSTKRFIRYPSKFIFTENQETFSTRIIDSENILASLFTDSTQGINYAYIEFNHENGQTAKVHASVDSYAIGKTIELQIAMKDNYSAGLQRYMEVISSSDVYMNKDVSYTDYYGKVNDIAMYVYYDNTAFTTAEEEAYPEASSNKGDELFTVITDYIDKDAREQPVFLIEIALLSEDPQMRVFNGFARYNKIVEGDDSIATGLLLYEPRPNAKLVDLSRVLDMTVTGTYEFGKMDFSWTASQSGVGIVWYDTNTLELVLAYLNDISSGSGSETKYYKIEESKYGGGYNIVFYLTSEFGLNAELSFVRGKSLTFNLTSELSFDSNITFYRSKDIGFSLDGGFDLSTNLTFVKGKMEALGLDSDMSLNSSLSFYRSKDIGIGLTSNFGLQGALTYHRSKNEGFSLSGTFGFGASITFTVYNPNYEWVSGGTPPTTGTTCAGASDVGNVKCEDVCSFGVTGTFTSLIDLSSTKPTCSSGAEYVSCRLLSSGNYLCTEWEGSISTECETCEVT
jgi:hypothetical protein